MQSQSARQLPDNPIIIGKGDVIWEPQPGSQEFFLSCPIYEVLYDGTRGPGKTDALLMDYAQHVGIGYGEAWRGILFRNTYKQLADIVARSKKWFFQIFPGSKFNESEYVWKFPTGEQLLFRYMNNADDYWNYHGHEYPWCVDSKTEVLMGDGSLKFANSVAVGEFVSTLEGPKQVLKKNVLFKKAVELSFFDDVGNKLGSQIQGEGHQLLTAYGMHNGLTQGSGREFLRFGGYRQAWLDYKSLQDDHLYNTRVFSFLQNLKNQLKLSPLFPKRKCLSLDKEGLYRKVWPLILTHFLCRIYKLNQYFFVRSREHSVSLTNDCMFCIAFRGVFQEVVRLFWYDSLLLSMLVLPDHLKKASGCVVHYESQIALIQYFLICRWFCLHHNDEQLRQVRETFLNIVPYFFETQEPMLFPLFDKDGLGFSRASARPTFYTHPYSGELHQSFYTSFSFATSCSFSPLPVRKLIDFTVADCSQYITKINKGQVVSLSPDKYLINKNCGWEELTNWPTMDCYDSMHACCRSSHPGMPRKYRSTSNPFGVGHSWVKRHMVDIGPAGTVVTDDEGNKRVRIHGVMSENKILSEIDPEYVKRIMAIKNPNKRKAWVEGSWDIVAGGAIDDLWDEDIHMIPPFDLPRHWKYDRSFDWGASHPFSVGWWAESDGTDIKLRDGRVKSYPPKTVFRIAEYYGWNGNPNEGCRMAAPNIAKKIKEIESHFSFVVQPGPADSSIYDAGTGLSIADEMGQQGIRWVKAVKGPGSRVTGLSALRTRLAASCETPMEGPGIFIFDTCTHFKRTVPVLPRDTKKLDDVATDAEDHCFQKDTKIITDSGVYRIKELVGKSGYILSTGGYYSRFYNCRKTRNSKVVRIVFDDGSEVVCTPDHKFLTTQGWAKGKDLVTVDEMGYRLLSFKNEGIYLCESKLLAILLKSLMEDVFIYVVNIFNIKKKDYTQQFGSFIKEMSQRINTYTIKSLIEAKIKLEIYNYLQSQNTNRFMQKLMTIPNGVSLCGRELLNGIEVKSELFGMRNNIKNTAKEKCTFVGEIMRGSHFKSFVPINVTQHTVELQEQILQRRFVFGVESSLAPRNIIIQSLVREAVEKGLAYQRRVKRIEKIERAESVYCMDVEYSSSFVLENGIVVSNCYDETRYRLTARASTVTEVEIHTH